MSNVSEISEASFPAEVLQSNLPVLVDFYAVWCGPCKMIAPALDALAGEFAGRVKVVKVDVDQAPGLAGQFRISSVPTLMIFKGGQPIDSMVGAPSPKATVRSALTAPGMSGMGVQFAPPQGEDVERLLALLQGLGVPVLELPVLTRRPVEPGAEGGGDVAQLQLQVQALLVALDESDRALEKCRRERTALAREVIKLRAALEKH